MFGEYAADRNQYLTHRNVLCPLYHPKRNTSLWTEQGRVGEGNINKIRIWLTSRRLLLVIAKLAKISATMALDW